MWNTQVQEMTHETVFKSACQYLAVSENKVAVLHDNQLHRLSAINLDSIHRVPLSGRILDIVFMDGILVVRRLDTNLLVEYDNKKMDDIPQSSTWQCVQVCRYRRTLYAIEYSHPDCNLIEYHFDTRVCERTLLTVSRVQFLRVSRHVLYIVSPEEGGLVLMLQIPEMRLLQIIPLYAPHLSNCFYCPHMLVVLGSKKVGMNSSIVIVPRGIAVRLEPHEPFSGPVIGDVSPTCLYQLSHDKQRMFIYDFAESTSSFSSCCVS